jgi:hypothetical protein
MQTTQSVIGWKLVHMQTTQSVIGWKLVHTQTTQSVIGWKLVHMQTTQSLIGWKHSHTKTMYIVYCTRMGANTATYIILYGALYPASWLVNTLLTRSLIGWKHCLRKTIFYLLSDWLLAYLLDLWLVGSTVSGRQCTLLQYLSHGWKWNSQGGHTCCEFCTCFPIGYSFTYSISDWWKARSQKDDVLLYVQWLGVNTAKAGIIAVNFVPAFWLVILLLTRSLIGGKHCLLETMYSRAMSSSRLGVDTAKESIIAVNFIPAFWLVTLLLTRSLIGGKHCLRKTMYSRAISSSRLGVKQPRRA